MKYPLTQLFVKILFFASILFNASLLNAFEWEIKTGVDKDGFTYQYIPNDPFASRIYRLENGLTIYLLQNKEQPLIYSLIAVKAGGADDPAESTGLAHYFEHMMFKGNDKIASLSPQKEDILLNEIENLFNQYRLENDKDKRAEIYQKIDELSLKAANYSNDEYWLLLRSIGATDINAWTGYDETVYVSTIPSVSLDKFLYLEFVRFSNIVLRRFHTELETVYEEFNRGQDNGARIGLEAMLQSLFLKHPYHRSILGLPEHLKSPSMTDIKTFFYQHYRPSNMGIIMCGDLQYEKTMQLIRKYFGLLKNPLVRFNDSKRQQESDDINEIRIVEAKHPDSEFVTIAYRFEPTEENLLMLDFLDQLMNNGLCGIMELDLELPRKVLQESSGTMRLKDYLIHEYEGVPTEGQSLEEVKDLILAEIEKLKTGDFPDWLPAAIVNNKRLSLITASESRENAAKLLKDTFILEDPLVNQLNRIEKQSKITKTDIVEFAQKHLNNNYVLTYKRNAQNPKQVTTEKPQISQIPVTDSLSPFAKNYVALPNEKENEPVFPDLLKDLSTSPFDNGVEFRSSQNTLNERFSLTFTFPAGTRSDKELSMALSLFDSFGTKKYSSSELKQEWYKLAASVSAFSGKDTCGFVLHGLQRNFDASLSLFLHILENIEPNQDVLTQFIAATKKSRQLRRTSASSKISAAASFALYGGKYNYNADIMPVQEMGKIQSDVLIERIKSIFDYKHEIFYYGPEKHEKIFANKQLQKLHPKGNLKQFPTIHYFKFANYDDNQVFLIPMDGATQASILLYRVDQLFSSNQYAFESVFSDSESRLMMTELRERQALAYSVYGGYATPQITPESFSYAYSAIESQHDKLLDSLKGIITLFNDDVTSQSQFETAKQNVLSQIRNKKINREYYDSLRRAMNKFHLIKSSDEIVYGDLMKMDYVSFKKQIQERISNKKNIIVILLDPQKFDIEKLKEFGVLHILSDEEIFPND